MGAERGGVRGRRTARSGVDRYGNQRRSWGFAAASLLVSFGGGRSGIPACRSCAGGRLPEDRDRTTADNFGRDACAFQASPSIGAYRVVNFSLAWVVKFSLAPKGCPLARWRSICAVAERCARQTPSSAGSPSSTITPR